jgi:hypothetical protein
MRQLEGFECRNRMLAFLAATLFHEPSRLCQPKMIVLSGVLADGGGALKIRRRAMFDPQPSY